MGFPNAKKGTDMAMEKSSDLSEIKSPYPNPVEIIKKIKQSRYQILQMLFFQY